MSIVIGITGGVGCGKSTVLDVLKNKYGAAVIEADKVGHTVMEKGTDAYYQILDCFSNQILDENDNIDRKKLGAIVFADESLLMKLDGIIHPAVKSYIKTFIANEKSKGTSLIIVEAALLIEAGYRDICDCFWYIFVDVEKRISRLMDSRGYTLEKIHQIMNNQLSEKEFKDNTDDVIDNNGDLNDLMVSIDEKLSKII